MECVYQPRPVSEETGGRERSDCIPSRVMASLLKAHTLVTSKLKSSLMLFIFKCSPLDRRHLVRHASQGRPWCSALLGSITRRQPFGADTKAAGLTRDLLWNLSQSCTTRRKHKCTQLLVYTHPDLSQYLSPTSATATTLEKKRDCLPKKSKSVKDLIFLCEINVNKSLICGN